MLEKNKKDLSQMELVSVEDFVPKEKHGMRFTHYRGLSQVTKRVRLKSAAMNLKKYAIHMWKGLLIYIEFCLLKPYYSFTA